MQSIYRYDGGHAVGQRGNLIATQVVAEAAAGKGGDCSRTRAAPGCGGIRAMAKGGRESKLMRMFASVKAIDLHILKG